MTESAAVSIKPVFIASTRPISERYDDGHASSDRGTSTDHATKRAAGSGACLSSIADFDEIHMYEAAACGLSRADAPMKKA